MRIIGAELLSGILRGHGKTVAPTVITAVGTVGGRVAWILGCRLLHLHDIRAIIFAYPFSWILTTALFLLFEFQTFANTTRSHGTASANSSS